MAESPTFSAVPSKHVFLHEIARQPLGSKVRFLCCVSSYDESKGQLHVQHDYPPSAQTIPSVTVTIDLVRESLTREHLQTGCWLNIIGYIIQTQGNKATKPRSRPFNTGLGVIQAIIIWSAGAIKIKDYEEILHQRRDLDIEKHRTGL